MSSSKALALTLADDEAGLHGGDSEGELLQASGRSHVPVALAAAPAPAAATVPWGAAGLDAPQQVGDDFGCMLGLVGWTHDLGYPLWRAAVVLFELNPDTCVALDLLNHFAVSPDHNSHCEPGHRNLGGHQRATAVRRNHLSPRAQCK